MIIDSLTHVTQDGTWFNTKHDASIDRLLREMDIANVSQSVVVALAGYIDNGFVYEICQRWADRLIPGASLDPCAHATPTQAAKEAQSVLCNGDFPILKLHPRLNGYDPLDDRCLAVLECVDSLAGNVHVWLDSIFRSDKCLLTKPPVDTVHSLLQQFPRVDFVLLHGGGPLLLQMMELLTGHTNLTLDLSLTMNYYAHTSIMQDILFLLEKRDRRICAGSDFPEYTQVQYLDALSLAAKKIKLPREDLDRIQGENLSALLSKRKTA